MTRDGTHRTPPRRLLAPDGTPVGDTEVGLSDEDQRDLLRWMMLARRLDRECVALQRQGELTVYPGFEGQEAAQIGSAFALGPRDMVFPSFRELAVALVHGVDPVTYLEYQRGTWHGGPYDPIESRFAAIAVPVATQICHAVGWGLGAKLDGLDACAIAYFGDGSASEGDFHEASNLAGVWEAPVVLFCQNNGWAISVPAAEQTAGEIWRRAEGYGFPGVLVDGNDVLAVYAVTREAVMRAHAGRGPTLIEAVTFRIGDHSTADDASRYRDPEAVARAREEDPIDRYRRYLVAIGLVDEAWLVETAGHVEARVGEIRAGVIATEPPPLEDAFLSSYVDPPLTLFRQRDEALGVVPDA